MKEMNSLWRQEIEEQNKRSGDKKLKSKTRGVATKKFMLRHSKELKAESMSRQINFLS